LRRSDLRGRKFDRVTLQRPGFIVLEPGGPWIECYVIDISDAGACLNVGALEVPLLFGLLMTPDGRVRRACLTAWRKNELLRARFLTARELRDSAVQTLPGQKSATDLA
jgi:hypothetical protein